MDPRHVLIVYGTTYGQTEKIAKRIRDLLRWHGCDVTLVNAADGVLETPLSWFDGIVVGASVIARGHQKAIERFVREHAAMLDALPSAFYSVSASAGSKDAKGRAAAEKLRDDFLAKVRWRPRLKESIAGAVNYTRYNALLRWYMKYASRKGGGATDTSRDHEYTDWAQVEHLADNFAALLETPATAPADLTPASV